MSQRVSSLSLDRLAFIAVGIFVLGVTWNGLRLGGMSVATPMLVGAFPGVLGFSLEVASYRGSWHRFAHLDLPEPGSENAVHQDVDFDPVLHPVPGLPQPEWLARLRAPAYSASRRARHRSASVKQGT